MDATHYSLTQASLEIIGLTLLMFVLGIVTCTLLRKLGLCCRKAVDDEPSLFTLKEPAAFDFDSVSNKSTTQTTIRLNESNSQAANDIPTLHLPTSFENQPSAPRPDLMTPLLDIELPTPTPVTITPPVLPPITIPHSTSHNDHAVATHERSGSGYVVDIDTLLRRKPEEPPTATIAAASKHQGYDTTQRNPMQPNTVSIADLLNTQTDLIDNLRKLAGVTPRIEALLNEAGIKNYSSLAQKSPRELKHILAAAGEQFQQIDPQTWPFQAELASKGEWTRLQDYQSYLKTNSPT